MSIYLEFYGFHEPPFNITPDPRFLFFAEHHRESFDHVIFGITSRKGFIELTGEVGTGKTTICRAVLANLDNTVKTALILNPCLTGTQLLRSILNDLGLTPKGRDRLSYIEILNAFLLEQLARNKNVALIIDEAQDLSAALLEQVRLLSNLETDQHKLLQIVLCGQPELHSRLDQPELRQLRQRITIRCHLPPLNETETARYIEHRTKLSGWRGGELFTREAVSGVYQYSKGTPRLTNAVCDVSLLAGYVAGSKKVDADCVRRAIDQLEGRK